MNANSVNDKRKAESDPEEGEITDPLVKKRVENRNPDNQDDKAVHSISNPSSSSKKKKNKQKKTPDGEEDEEVDPTPAKSKASAPDDDEEEKDDDDEEEVDENPQGTTPNKKKKKKKKKAQQHYAKLDIENYPEQQILLCSYNDCPMLVHISKVDIQLPNHFYSKQRQVRSGEERNTFEKDPNVVEHKLEHDLKRYWEQRYFLFNKYDKGIKLDRESWYSVTPEPVAHYTATRLKGAKVILDAFAGAGGNSIQFAHHCEKVISNDIDPVKTELLRHNAGIYGVQGKIDAKTSDFLKLEIPENQNIDLVFLAPPWGGVDYTKPDYSIFEKVTPDIRQILSKGFQYSQNIVFNLGRNTLLQEIVQLFVEYFEKNNINPTSVGIEIEKVYVTGKLKLIAVYYGQIATLHRSKEYEYCYSLFQNDNLTKKTMKALFKSHGIRKFLTWLQKYPKKFDLSSVDALAYKQHIEGTFEAPKTETSNEEANEPPKDS